MYYKIAEKKFAKLNIEQINFVLIQFPKCTALADRGAPAVHSKICYLSVSEVQINEF